MPSALERLEALAKQRKLRLRWETVSASVPGARMRIVDVFDAGGRWLTAAVTLAGRSFDEDQASEACATQLLAPI